MLFVLFLSVLALTHSFEIDEEFEKEEPTHTPRKSQVWFPSVALQDFHAGASEVTISVYSRTGFQPHKNKCGKPFKTYSFCSWVASTNSSVRVEKMSLLFSHLSTELTVGCVHGLKCTPGLLAGRDSGKICFLCLLCSQHLKGVKIL